MSIIKKFILPSLLVMNICNGFVYNKLNTLQSKNMLSICQNTHLKTSHTVLYNNKNDNNYNKNNSKIFKMDFSDDNPDDWIYKPKYAFGLSEYDFTLLKIYVYMVITLHFIGIIIQGK